MIEEGHWRAQRACEFLEFGSHRLLAAWGVMVKLPDLEKFTEFAELLCRFS